MAQTSIGIIFIMAAVYLGFCGQFHVRHGRNFRGFLASGFLPRHGPDCPKAGVLRSGDATEGGCSLAAPSSSPWVS
jgi:hypothetical protein